MKKKRLLYDLSLKRMAICHSQAQDGAEITFAKSRSDAPDAVEMAKRIERATELAKMKPMPNEDEATYVSRFMADKAMSAEYSDEKQRAAVAHQMFRQMQTGKSLTPQAGGEPAMTTEQETALKADLAKSNAERDAAKIAEQAAVKKAERAERVALLTDAERVVFKSLPTSEQDNFLVCSSVERSAICAKHDDRDPVVYKSASGRVYRRSDDPEKVQFAKRLDDNEAALAKSEAARTEEVLKARASSELKHFKGDVALKAAILRVVDTLPTEGDVRKNALEALKSADAALEFFSKSRGSRGTDTSPSGAPGSATEKLNALAKAKADASGGKLTFAKAYAQVLESPEGQELAIATREEAVPA